MSHIATNNTELLINEQIREREVRLIDEEGNQLGVVSTPVALRMAEERGLDLVLIAAQAAPPVCRIADYSKYRFEKAKQQKEQRKNSKVVELKEVRLSATIDVHDMEVKARAAVKFLQNGDKVKATIRFRGRQVTHGEIGVEIMNRFFEMVSEYASIDKATKLEGRNMFMVLAPKSAK